VTIVAESLRGEFFGSRCVWRHYGSAGETILEKAGANFAPPLPLGVNLSRYRLFHQTLWFRAPAQTPEHH
jgi:hypothetical protein